MKIMRILCVIVALAMVFSVAACVGETGGETGGSGSGGGSDGTVGNGSGGSDGAGGSGSGSGGGSDGNTGSGTSGGDKEDTQKPDPGDGESGGNGGDSGDGSVSGGGSGDGESGGGGSGGADGSGGSGGSDGSVSGGGSGGDGGSGGTGGGALSGSAVEVLASLVDELIAAGVEMPMALPPSEVAPELSQNTIGLSEGDFGRLVVSAANSLAAIGTFAHQIIIIQAKDSRAASEIKGLVSGANGYDPQKWICVWPEQAVAVDAGEYVLIVAAHANVVEAAVAALKEAAGTIGDVVMFWEFKEGP